VAARPTFQGRWFAVPAEQTDTAQVVQAVSLGLARYGVVTRGAVLTEAWTPGYLDVYRVLSAMEDAGTIRRGYFVDGLGAAQFALPGAVDRLRDQESAGLVLLAACDPANPWGAALRWPDSLGHRPSRSAGAIVVLDHGWPVLYLERGAHTLVSFDQDQDRLGAALSLVGSWVDSGRLGTVTITKVNGTSALQAFGGLPGLARAGFVLTPQGVRRRSKL
jgi:ATP-dependent Lhr-like helicase